MKISKCIAEGCNEDAESEVVPWCIYHLAELSDMIEEYPLVPGMAEKELGKINVESK